MAKTWSGIIDNGIDQDERKNLISKYPIPTNVRRLKAPLLNEIIMKATSESVVKRDARLADLQNQLAAGISAIGGVIDSMLYEERGGGNRAHLQALCDAGRLLTDVLNMETTARKRLVSYNLDKNIKDTLISSPTNEFLFGSDLDKRVEASKQLDRSVRNIKPTKSTPVKKTTGNRTNLNNLSLPRPAQGGRQGRRHFQYQNRSSFYQQPPGRGRQSKPPLKTERFRR